PGTLAISVREYTPAAYVRVAGGVMLVAANGHVIARVTAPPAKTIEIRGVRQAPDIGQQLSPADAAGIVQQLPDELAIQVAAIDVSGNGPALVLARGGEIRLGTAGDLAEKSAAALAVLQHLGDQTFSYIDVSTPLRPISHG